jgi:3-oxoacyl-[acyl-carrier-protein] synthase II
MKGTERRVGITGIGMICSLGTTREEVWNGLVEGRCGIGPLSLFESEGYRSCLVAEIPDYGASRRFTALERRRLSRSDQVAIVAANEALEDSGLLDSSIDRTRVGLFFGSGTGDMLRNERYFADVLTRGIDRARPSQAFNHFTSTPADAVAERHGLEGMKACLLSACSSTTAAIGYAADTILGGRHVAALCGGSDVLCRLTLSGFNALRLVAPEPCRPFDVNRNGLNLGEAGAVLVLEDLDRARRRGAHIYAELAGYGLACEAYHPTAPEPTGGAFAAMVERALDAARIDRGAVDHVNSHGTATVQNDRAEAAGIGRVFGDRSRAIPINSIKSMVGHCLGAAGAIEAAALALSISRNVVPPTVHHDRTDPECPLDIVANEAREARIQCGVSISLAFGGNDATLVMRRYS